MNNTLFKKIKRANSKYAEYLSACDKDIGVRNLCQ